MKSYEIQESFVSACLPVPPGASQCRRGVSVAEDLEEAAKWFRRSADRPGFLQLNLVVPCASNSSLSKVAIL